MGEHHETSMEKVPRSKTHIITQIVTATSILTGFQLLIKETTAAREHSEMLKSLSTKERIKIDCGLDQTGCYKGFCFRTCGPRLRRADWCFITDDTKTMDFIDCKVDSDCNKPCLTCAMSCIPEEALVIINGTIYND